MKKKQQKQLVYAGVAAVAGYFGWKYYQKKKAEAPPAPVKI